MKSIMELGFLYDVEQKEKKDRLNFFFESLVVSTLFWRLNFSNVTDKNEQKRIQPKLMNFSARTKSQPKRLPAFCDGFVVGSRKLRFSISSK